VADLLEVLAQTVLYLVLETRLLATIHVHSYVKSRDSVLPQDSLDGWCLGLGLVLRVAVLLTTLHVQCCTILSVPKQLIIHS